MFKASNILFITSNISFFTKDPILPNDIFNNNIPFINKKYIYKQLFNNQLSAIFLNDIQNLNLVLSIDNPKIIIANISQLLKLYSKKINYTMIDYAIIDLNNSSDMYTAMKFLKANFKFFDKKILIKDINKFEKKIIIADITNKQFITNLTNNVDNINNINSSCSNYNSYLCNIL